MEISDEMERLFARMLSPLHASLYNPNKSHILPPITHLTNFVGAIAYSPSGMAALTGDNLSGKPEIFITECFALPQQIMFKYPHNYVNREGRVVGAIAFGRQFIGKTRNLHNRMLRPATTNKCYALLLRDTLEIITLTRGQGEAFANGDFG